MSFKSIKALLVLVFSVLLTISINSSFAQDDHKEKKPEFNAKELIFGHVLNAHEFHFLDIKHEDGKVTHIGIPLPVILYSPQRGFSCFMSSEFEEGHKSFDGYMLLSEESIEKLKLDDKKYNPQEIVSVDKAGNIDSSVKVYDVSLTRNVVQMILGLTLFVWVMLRIAKPPPSPMRSQRWPRARSM